MKIPKILSQKIKEKYNISRNTFICKDKGKKAEEREVEIGDIHSDIFQPQVKLKQWENETNFSARLIDDELFRRSRRIIRRRPRIRTAGDKIKFIKDKLEAHFYETKTDKKTDAFEFEVILKEKPKTNKVRMSIRTKGLKFYYQLPLNEERHDKRVVKSTPTDCYDKDGKVICHRPENVVGSYAVYHESKQGDYSKMGGKNYRAGKAFHIYRPKITDANGNWTWGKLNIDEKKGILTIEIDQNFLDKAVYSVKIDPTFGYTAEGGTIYGIYDDDMIGGRYSLSESGEATSISGYVYGYGSGQVGKFGIYDSNRNFEGGTYEFTAESYSKAWKTEDLTSSVNLAAGDYYLMMYINDYIGLCYDDASNTWERDNDAGTYPTFPNSFSPDASGTDNKFSIYCTYTAGGGAAFTPKVMFF